MWTATRQGHWKGTVVVVRQGTGQGALLVARCVADEVTVKVADEVARLVPREVARTVIWQATGIAMGGA
jgi:hypothetical protein